MPRSKTDAPGEESAADARRLTGITTPPAPSFATLIETVTARVEALAQRAIDVNLTGTGVAIRLRGRSAVATLRELADSERRLNAMGEHIKALERMGGRTAPAPAPPATSARSAPPLRRISHLEAELRFVRARAKGEEALAAEKEAIHRESGFGPKRIAALLASTNGSRKQQWARKALRSVTGDERQKLAAELEGYGYGSAKDLLRLARR